MDYIEVEEIIWFRRQLRPFLGDDDDAYTEEEDVDVSEYEPFIQLVEHEDGSETFRILADFETLRDRLTTVCFNAYKSSIFFRSPDVLFVSQCDEVRLTDNNTKVEILQSDVAQDDEEAYHINNILGMPFYELHVYIENMAYDEIDRIQQAYHPDGGVLWYIRAAESYEVYDEMDEIEECREAIISYKRAQMLQHQNDIFTRLRERRARLFDVEGAISATVGALPGFHNTVLLEQIIRYQVFVSDDNQLREDIARRIVQNH